MWPDLIAKSKEGGAEIIETYTFWNGHEPVRGKVGHFSNPVPLAWRQGVYQMIFLLFWMKNICDCYHACLCSNKQYSIILKGDTI